MFGFFNLSNVKRAFKENRQVYFSAALIIFAGFLFGALYSNLISDKNFANYRKFIDNIVNGSVENIFPFSATSADIKNLILIFFWGFFLFGKPFSGFFAFKSGFSIGFFISFFVKAYSFKGFLTGAALLLNYVVFVIFPIIRLTGCSFIVNSEITGAIFEKTKSNAKNVLFSYLLTFLLSFLITLFGNYINSIFIPKIISTLF